MALARLFAGESSGELMTTIKAIRLASLVTAINVLVASGFSIAAIIRPQYLAPCRDPFQRRRRCYWRCTRRRAESLWLCSYWERSTSRRRPRCCSWVHSPAPCNCWMPESVCLSTILGNALGRSFFAVLQFFVVYLLHRSRRKPSADRLSPNVVPVAPDCRREFWEPYSTRTN